MIEDWIGGVLFAIIIMGLYSSGKWVFRKLATKEVNQE